MQATPRPGSDGRAASDEELAQTEAGSPTPDPALIDPHGFTATSSGHGTPYERGGFDPAAELAQAQREGRFYGAVLSPPKIDKYILLDHLGHGGMGSVYTVYNPDLDRKSVIKLVRPDRSGPDTRQRLLREARLTATVSHPNVIVIHDSGEFRDEVYVVMEYIAGVDLDQWRRRGPHPWRQVLAVYHQAGLGLAAAHARSIVHRDFTPRNAMLGDDGRVRVLDFGLAHACRPGPAPAPQAFAPHPSDSLTATGAIVGTPRYMSPEQIRGITTDARSDQFSFCVALWEALLGPLPFAGTDIYDYNEAVTTGAVRMPEVTRGVPGRVLRTLRRGLSPDPADRWPDMPALLAALTPAAARPRWFIAPIAAALALARGRGLTRDDPQTPAAQQCATDLAGALDDVWGADQRAAVQRTIAATDPAAATAVLARLDGFAAQWLARRTELCAATLAGGLPAAAQRRGQQCLAGHRAVLGDLTIRVAAGTASDLGLTDLPDDDRLAACTDPLRIADGGAPPSVAARDDAARIDADLARAAAALIVGSYHGSEAIAASAVSRARVLGHAPTLAAALNHHARALSYGPRAPAAEAELREAAGLAERHDLHDLAADIYLRLIRVAQTHGERPADGHIWFEVLGHQLARLDESHGRREADALAMLGRISLDAGDLAAARRFADRSAAADEHAGPFERALLAVDLGRIARLRGETAPARNHFEQALALGEQALGRNHPKLVPVLLNLGEVALAGHDLETASASFDRAHALLGAQSPFTGQAQLDLALVAEARGDLAGARTLAEQARAALRGRQVPLDVRRHRVQVLDLVGRTALALGDHGTALSAGHELLAMPVDPPPWDAEQWAIAYHNAGSRAVSCGQMSVVLRMVAAARRTLAGLPLAATREWLEAGLAINEAVALAELGRSFEAADVAARALQRWDPRDDRNDALTAELHLQLFDALKTHDPVRARGHAIRARDLFTRTDPPTSPTLVILETWLRRYPPR